MKIKSLFIIAIVVAFLIGCANQRALQGGDKDGIAPVLTSVYPASLSTNFGAKTIEFQFDEYIQLNNIYDELVISPPLKTKPSIKVKSRSVIVELKEELKPNTTYTFNFGDGVVDLNESNKAQNLIYVVSTGSALDSLAVVGNVTYPFSNEKAAGVKILLFEDTVDLLAAKTPPPAFFAKANGNGEFAIQYLPSRNFQMIALEDLNGNYAVDSDERISLIEKNVNPSIPDSTITGYEIKMTPQREKEIRFYDYDVDSTGILIFPWSHSFDYLDEQSFRILNENNLDWFSTINLEQDTLRYVFMGSALDKRVFVEFTHNKEVDTIQVPFFKEAFPEKVKFSHSISSKIVPTEYSDIYLPYLVDSVNTSRTELFEDSTSLGEIYLDMGSPMHYSWIQNLGWGKKYELRLYPGLFVDDYNHTNDTLKIKFSTYKKEDLGIINLTVAENMRDSLGRIQMIDKKGKVYRELTAPSDGVLNITNIIPGEYNLRYYVDYNNNGGWDPIDWPLQGRFEEVYYQTAKINVRANWEIKASLEFTK
jgi:Bacterial Ig-like domain